MEAFATIRDYAERYGAPDDEGRLGALLADASAFIASHPGFSMREDEVFAANLVRITCAVVHRALSAGPLAGLSAASQGAGGQTASVTVYNPAGDLFLTKQEKRALGIGGARVGTTDPYGEGAP